MSLDKMLADILGEQTEPSVDRDGLAFEVREIIQSKLSIEVQEGSAGYYGGRDVTIRLLWEGTPFSEGVATIEAEQVDI